MSTEIVVATPLDVELVERAARLAERPRSAATLRAYAADWRAWEAWCSSHGLSALPATEGAIVAYVAHLASLARRHASIVRAYATIRAYHLDAGRPLPTLEAVRNALTNVGREIGTAPHGKTPLMADTLRHVARLYALDAGDLARGAAVRMLAVRDRALLLVGWGGARRPSEVAGLDVGDVAFVDAGLVLTVRRSKTDQGGAGLPVGVALGSSPETCPSRALRAWLDAAGLTEGPAFRGVDRRGQVLAERLSAEGVARAVRRAVTRVGLDAAPYGGHSLRSGFATSAAAANKPMHAIMRQGGWTSDRTVRERYVRPGTLFLDNASEGLL